jgi:hypothetical protein
MKNAASLLIFACVAAASAVAGNFKTDVITTDTRTINVPDNHFLRIYNFTQQGGTERGVVIVSAPSPTPTPAPTPTPSVTPTPTPTPTATPTPTPTPPPEAVLTAIMISPDASLPSVSSSTPEPIKRITIDGPAQVTVAPVSGATLVLTYKKQAEPTPTPTP